MRFYRRLLRYRLPMMRGEDVLAVQLRLRELGCVSVGEPDGLFGHRTEESVRAFQQSRGLRVDAVVGPKTWADLFAERPQADRVDLTVLGAPHSYRDSVEWYVEHKGLLIGTGAAPETTSGEPITVRRAWGDFGTLIEQSAAEFDVPVELIVATICTETRGKPDKVRIEPGWISDEETPHRVSPGLMQTLISTAREALGKDDIDREWLLEPQNSIRAGTAYISQQWGPTGFDPPKVACAYNAGGIYYNESSKNRWKMRQFPIGTSKHADRFVKWFNDCFVMFDKDKVSLQSSFFAKLSRSQP